tara:strand:+ start:71 stop:325 length:255 start_codon:yes stop_codon:yes gene_type:complete
MKNFTVVGAGYVGMSLAALLAQKFNVKLLEIDKEKVKKINNREPAIKDISDFKSISEIILANRMAEELNEVRDKVYTPDLFGRD